MTIGFLPFHCLELMACEDLWRLAKGQVAANRFSREEQGDEVVQALAEQALECIAALSPPIGTAPLACSVQSFIGSVLRGWLVRCTALGAPLVGLLERSSGDATTAKTDPTLRRGDRPVLCLLRRLVRAIRRTTCAAAVLDPAALALKSTTRRSSNSPTLCPAPVASRCITSCTMRPLAAEALNRRRLRQWQAHPYLGPHAGES